MITIKIESNRLFIYRYTLLEISLRIPLIDIFT